MIHKTTNLELAEYAMDVIGFDDEIYDEVSEAVCIYDGGVYVTLKDIDKYDDNVALILKSYMESYNIVEMDVYFEN